MEKNITNKVLKSQSRRIAEKEDDTLDYRKKRKRAPLVFSHLSLVIIKTEKPQLHAEASVMRVATTYFPTTLVQYHRRCGA